MAYVRVLVSLRKRRGAIRKPLLCPSELRGPERGTLADCFGLGKAPLALSQGSRRSPAPTPGFGSRTGRLLGSNPSEAKPVQALDCSASHPHADVRPHSRTGLHSRRRRRSVLGGADFGGECRRCPHGGARGDRRAHAALLFTVAEPPWIGPCFGSASCQTATRAPVALPHELAASIAGNDTNVQARRSLTASRPRNACARAAREQARTRDGNALGVVRRHVSA